MVRVSFATTLLFMIVGCGTTVSEKEQLIPVSERSMKEVYDDHGAGNATRGNDAKLVISRPATSAELVTNPYLNNHVNDRPTFNKLPNPTLYIYFSPKLSSDGRMPIPAWMSEFQMYDKDEYALPGELNLGERQ